MCTLIKSKIFDAAEHCLDDINEPEDEILYGTAGYLQTLLLIKKEIGLAMGPLVKGDIDVRSFWEDFIARLNSIIKQIAIKLMTQTSLSIENGTKTILQANWPRHRRRGSLYIGGAHGTLGILYTVLQACLMDETILLEKEDALSIIVATCEDLLKLQ